MQEIINLIKKAKCLTAFTGAGISVESGIPPFRGAGGLWEKYDPKYIEIEFFYSHPKESWAEMKKIFFNSMGVAQPNIAHKTLAKLEELGFLKGIITQNIDNLHQKAGNKKVLEYHGTIDTLVCTKCYKRYKTKDAENQGFYLQKEMKIVPIEGKEPNRINMQLVVNQVDEVVDETFVLRNQDHSFTKEYKDFLKDYYLD